MKMIENITNILFIMKMIENITNVLSILNDYCAIINLF